MKQDDPTPALPLSGEGVERATSKANQQKNHTHRQGVFNPRSLKPVRQRLRGNLTAPEKHLWQKIRGRQLGVKFRRQHGVGRYIVDFYCAECALVIEVDGDSHYNAEARESDQERNQFIQSLGIETLRFTNTEVMKNMDGVIHVIQQTIKLKFLT